MDLEHYLHVAGTNMDLEHYFHVADAQLSLNIISVLPVQTWS